MKGQSRSDRPSGQASLARMPIKGTAHRPEYGPAEYESGGGAPGGPAPMVPARPPKQGTVAINLRLQPALHHRATLRVFAKGGSLNSLIVEALKKLLDEPS